MATSAATVAAAAAARARREVREYFDRNNAFDAAHAVTYDPPGRIHRRHIEALLGRGVLVATGDGRYWLDREAAAREEERQRAAGILMLKLVLIGVALAIAAVAIVKAAG